MQQRKITLNSRYNSVLQPLAINNIRLPNRIIFPGVQASYANLDGTVSDKLINFYEKIAAGGCGLIITGSAAVSKESIAGKHTMTLCSDECISGLTKLFSAIEKHGSVPGIQLMHYGRQATKNATGYDLLAPSALPCPVMSKLDPIYCVREMTADEIQQVENDFVNAAIRAAKAGAKVIEIHAAHGYLLNEFLSPYSNHRTDGYGGSVINRTRIICEIIAKIRSQLQRQIAISVRVSGNEFVPNGLVPENFQQIIPLLEDAGMDMLDISTGVAETINYIIPDAAFGEAPFVDIAATIKQFATVPVSTVGLISSLNTAEKILSSNKVDLVAIGRAQIAAPDLVKKSLTGREKEIKKCLCCNRCVYWATNLPEMRCIINKDL